MRRVEDEKLRQRGQSLAETLSGHEFNGRNAPEDIWESDDALSPEDYENFEEAVVDQAIADQPDAWAKFCAGDGKAMGAIVGAVMKATQGKAEFSMEFARYEKVPNNVAEDLIAKYEKEKAAR